jgi:hypothetical protein
MVYMLQGILMEAQNFLKDFNTVKSLLMQGG